MQAVGVDLDVALAHSVAAGLWASRKAFSQAAARWSWQEHGCNWPTYVNRVRAELDYH
jgi:hypothetical protein